MTIKFSYHSNGKEIELEGNILQLHIAGWTGRDLDAVEGHIQELEALDITRPKSIPIFYSCAASLLTNNTHIEVSGEKTSGEVEPVLLNFNNRLFVGIGSDHTDRHLESISVSLSKQICSKPISKELWLYEEVAPHWDSLIMKSYIVKNGKRELYQQGCLELIRPVGRIN